MCRLSGVPRSSLDRRPRPQSEWEISARQAMREVALEFPAYGYRRVLAEMKRRGWRIGERRVRRWMRVGGKTFERYSEIVHKNLIPSLGALRLPQLQPIRIEEFYAEMLESGRKNGDGGLSPRTVVHFHRVLRAALQQGIKWKFIVINQADAVEPPSAHFSPISGNGVRGRSG